MTGTGPFRATPHDVCRILFRHKKKGFLAFGLVIAMTVAAIVVLPRKYVSEAKLLVRVGRETISIDPTVTSGQVIPTSPTWEAEVNSVLEMLTSRATLEKVVDVVGAAAILDKPAGVGKPTTVTAVSLLRLGPSEPVSDREQAVSQLAESIEVWTEKHSSVVTIRYKARSPRLAQAVVANLVKAYLDEHVRVNRNPGSYDFFAEQSAMARDHLKQATDQLRDAKNQVVAASLEGKQKAVQDQISALEMERLRAQTGLAASEKKIVMLRERLTTQQERILTDELTGLANAGADQMRQQLYDLEIREAELASRFSPDYPLLTAMRRQIALAKQILDEQPAERSQRTTSINPVHQQLQLSLLAEEAQAGALKAQADSAGVEYAALEKQLKDLNDQEGRLLLLQREVELAGANYKTYSEKMEQSRIEQALEQESISNINVAQPASYVAAPASPKPVLLAAVGLVLAVAGAFGLMMGAELIDHSSPREKCDAQEDLAAAESRVEPPGPPGRSRSREFPAAQGGGALDREPARRAGPADDHLPAIGCGM